MKSTVLMLLLCSTVIHAAHAQHNSTLFAQLDKVATQTFSSNGPGGTVLVSSHGKIIYQKAFGLANVELNVPMQTNQVFRIGSITKQFTAIAILQLMEAGQLNLQDEITKYIPDYPVQGAKVTIENLLTHTSGIRDYTTIKDTIQRSKMDIIPAVMISYFKNEPMRFAPGTRYEYSNSNYFLLGYIIEKLTGKTYQQYLQDHFFQPLGMSNSYYDTDTAIIKNRAAGYTQGQKNMENTAFISMTQPYAAGAILSTAEDLFKWNQALQSYKLVKKETIEKAFTRYKLQNGKDINYGYGFRLGYIQESPSIWHGGLINGFVTMAMYLPAEDVYVVVLTNCNCISPEIATAKLAAIAIGKPYDHKEITLSDAGLKVYTGMYENDGGDQLTVSSAEGKLYLQRGNAPKTNVKAFKKDNFFFENQLITIKFSVTDAGQSNYLTIQTRNGNEIWKKSDKPETVQQEIKVDEKILAMYAGEYEVTPQFSFIITKEKDHLYLEAKGQPKMELFAESNNKFYLKVSDARFEFVMEAGKVVKAILRQSGKTADAFKIK